MNRHTLGAAGLLWLALSAAAAQGPDDAVLLRYRFQPGQEYRYRMTVTGDLSTTMTGANLPPGAAMPRIPMTLATTWEMVQKVKAVSPEGTATVSVGFEKLDTTMAVMGTNVTSRLGEGGKLETIVNGQPAAVPGGERVLPNPFVEMSVDPSGKVSGINPESLKSMSELMGGQNLSGMFGGNIPGIGSLVLPVPPIKPGGTWETRWTMRLPIVLPGGPAGAGGMSPVLTANYAVHNKLLRVEDGRAVIESQITVTSLQGAKLPLAGMAGPVPGMTVQFEKMEQSMTGTQRFRIADGAVEGSDFDAKMDIRLAMGLPAGLGAPPPPAPKPTPRRPLARSRGGKPAPRAPAASRSATTRGTPPPASMSMKIATGGTMKMKLERLTAPEAGAAP